MKNEYSNSSLLFSIVVFISFLMLQSCYSVRISGKNSVPEKKAVSSGAGFYRDKVVHEMDTTITFNVIQNDATLIEDLCPDGFYSLEYRVNLGHVLLNGITLGKVKKVKIKYVCTKESN